MEQSNRKWQVRNLRGLLNIMAFQTIVDTSAQDITLAKPLIQPKQIVYGSLIAVVAIALLWSGFFFYRTSDVDEILQEDALRFAVVERGNFLRDLLTQGRVITANSPTLFSPESGFAQLKVKAGDPVSQGQLLVEVLSPGLDERLEQEMALVDKLGSELERKKLEVKRRKFSLLQDAKLARLNLDASEREKGRADKLIGKNIISMMNYEKVVDSHNRAQLELSLAEQTLAIGTESLEFELNMVAQDLLAQKMVVESVQRRLQRLKITSPVTGMVGSLQVKDKQAIGGYQALITVVDLTRFEMEAPVPEDYADDLAPGMKVEIKLNKAIYWGELLAVSPEVIHSQVVTRIAFTPPYPENLRQNQRLSLRIFIRQKQDVLMVDRGNFIDSFEGSVFVRNGDRAIRRTVKLGDRSYAHVEIVDGLKRGEEIIISSATINRHSEVLLIRD
ncbi:HlyD family secretion protein [Alteromonadaceae bacterium Bs31]|nr:HlyD family secretion protein [Alteromonadaceae bacterium Bs31]